MGGNHVGESYSGGKKQRMVESIRERETEKEREGGRGREGGREGRERGREEGLEGGSEPGGGEDEQKKPLRWEGEEV